MVDPTTTHRAPRWPKRVLLAAAAYNLAWGAGVILFPNMMFQFAGMDLPRYPEIWQCVGMIVGVYGVGYALAARDPARHWPLVLVGLLGKILGPIGFVHAAWKGTLPWSLGWTIVTNDLVWWWPFAAILLAARRRHQAGLRAPRDTAACDRPSGSQTIAPDGRPA